MSAVLLALLALPPSLAGRDDPVVAFVALNTKGIVLPEVDDPDQLLRDLGRSPLWKLSPPDPVSGRRSASLRVVQHPQWAQEPVTWLAAAVAEERPTDARAAVALSNGSRSLPGGGYLSVAVTQSRPDEAVLLDPNTIGVAPLSVPIHEFAYGGRRPTEVGPNAWSMVAVPLADELWLVVRQQGKSLTRLETWGAIELVAKELGRVEALPAEYRAEEVYADVFAYIGATEPGSLRYPGLQDRDTLGLVLRTEATRDYDGVRVHVFDEQICHGECTRDFRQERKAEALGKPPPGDLALVVVEDCAVFLDADGSQKYGTFSGSAPFEAEIRWLDAKGRTLHSEQGPFRGWER